MSRAWLLGSVLLTLSCGDGRLRAFEATQAVATPVELLLDDFEDADARANGEVGWWYLVNDESGTQRFSIEPAPDRPASNYCIRTQGSGFNDWGAALGLNLKNDQPLFDASGFGRLTFWARAAPESSREVSVELLNLEHQHFIQSVTFTTEWREISLPLLGFERDGVPIDSARLEALQLFLAVNQAFDVWLDDVRLAR